MDQITPVVCTSAPFGGVQQYTDNEPEYFGTVQETEKRFSKLQGEEILSYYLVKLNKMLNDIATFVSPSTTSTFTRSFNKPVFYANLKYERMFLLEHENDRYCNIAYVWNMNTRPCFAGHHFALFFLYWLINRCVKYNRQLVICEPLETTRSLLGKHFTDMFEKHEYDDNYKCDMQKATAFTDTGIERLFTILDNDTIALQTSAIPTQFEQVRWGTQQQKETTMPAVA